MNWYWPDLSDRETLTNEESFVVSKETVVDAKPFPCSSLMEPIIFEVCAGNVKPTNTKTKSVKMCRIKSVLVSNLYKGLTPSFAFYTNCDKSYINCCKGNKYLMEVPVVLFSYEMNEV